MWDSKKTWLRVMSVFIMAAMLWGIFVVSPGTALAGANVVLIAVGCDSVVVGTDDLFAGPITITITNVTQGSTVIGSGAISNPLGTATFVIPIAPQPKGGDVIVASGLGGPRYQTFGGSCTPVVLDPLGDKDNDGVANKDDNCLDVPNHDQADGWGSLLGDVCDTDYYDNGNGVKSFKQKNGLYSIFGDCDAVHCKLVGNVDPALLADLEEGAFQRFSTEQSAWFVDVYFLGTSEKGESVYQVNVYDAGGTLISDKLFILVKGEETSQVRG